MPLIHRWLILDTKRISGASLSPLSLLPLPKLFTSAYVTGVRTMTKVLFSPREVVLCHRGVDQFLRYLNEPAPLFNFSRLRKKCWNNDNSNNDNNNNNSENEGKLGYRGRWKEILTFLACIRKAKARRKIPFTRTSVFFFDRNDK